MNAQSEIDRITQNVADTYSALEEKGATMPAEQNSDNLAATARSVPAGGTTGVSVQADWNQTDETAPDFIKNKPFGETPNLLFSGNFAFEDADGTIAYIFEDGNLSFTNEQAVTVMWDGVCYSCTALRIATMQVVGDTSYLGFGDSSECPFCLFTEDGVLWIFCDTSATEPTSHTVQIDAAALSKLPEKYVPHTIIYSVPIDGVNRLCWDLNGTKIITIMEWMKIIGKPFWLLDAGASGTPRSFSSVDDSSVQYFTGYSETSGIATVATAYTAECTPET